MDENANIDRRGILKLSAMAGVGVVTLGRAGLAVIHGDSNNEPDELPEELRGDNLTAEFNQVNTVIQGFDISAEQRQRLPQSDSNVNRIEDAELVITMRDETPAQKQIVALLNRGGAICVAGTDASRKLASEIYDISESRILESRSDTQKWQNDDLDMSFAFGLSPETGYKSACLLHGKQD